MIDKVKINGCLKIFDIIYCNLILSGNKKINGHIESLHMTEPENQQHIAYEMSLTDDIIKDEHILSAPKSCVNNKKIREWRTRKGIDRILSFGDSHGEIFSYMHEINHFYVGPGTVWQLNNINSTVGHKRKIIDIINQHDTSTKKVIILTFGEIDLRTHILKHAFADGISADIITSRVALRFIQFALKLASSGNEVIINSPHCAGGTDHPSDGYLEDRNYQCLYLNFLLQNLCRLHGIGYISLFSKVVNKNTFLNNKHFFRDDTHLVLPNSPVGQLLQRYLVDSITSDQDYYQPEFNYFNIHQDSQLIMQFMGSCYILDCNSSLPLLCDYNFGDIANIKIVCTQTIESKILIRTNASIVAKEINIYTGICGEYLSKQKPRVSLFQEFYDSVKSSCKATDLEGMIFFKKNGESIINFQLSANSYQHKSMPCRWFLFALPNTNKGFTIKKISMKVLRMYDNSLELLF